MRNPDEQAFAIPAPGRPIDPVHDALLAENVQAELISGFQKLAGVERAVSVFGSTRTGAADADYQLARSVAARLGREGFAIITGGGSGIMEAANRGAQEVGALSVGLLIEPLTAEGLNPHLDLRLRFRYFFARKLMFVRYAWAFVIFPGGYGTLDELFDLAALAQTGRVRTPSIVLARRTYWKPLFDWLRDSVVAEGKISAADLDLFTFADDEDEVAACIASASREEETAWCAKERP
jgi:uncharacterized protein (TIGR00730 family)